MDYLEKTFAIIMRKSNILKIVKEMPGVSYNEIVRQSNLSNGVVSHYILKLMDEGHLEKYGDGRSKYFDSKVSENDRRIISILRNDTNLMIVRLLLKSKRSITSHEISEAINRSTSTVSVSLKNLQKNKIVDREILNENVKIRSDIGYRITDREFFKRIFSKYKI